VTQVVLKEFDFDQSNPLEDRSMSRQAFQSPLHRSKVFASALLVAALGLLAGCDKLGWSRTDNTGSDTNNPGAVANADDFNPGCLTDVAEWREEVKLFSGEQIVVWRRARACKGGFPERRGRDLDFELKYEPMGVHWKGRSARNPASFEIIDGVPYLTLFIMNPSYCKDQPPDRKLAQILKWQQGQWIEVPHEQFPFDKALLNLYTQYWGHSAKDDAKGLIPSNGKVTGGGPTTTLEKYYSSMRNVCSAYHETIVPMGVPPSTPASTPSTAPNN
jgi:hypothetical protein